MIKKIALATILALGSLSMAAPQASAFDDGCVENPQFGVFCDDTPNIPTPPAILAAIGMGVAGLRKKQQQQNEE